MENIKTINDLPADILPPFWQDKERINALYAPFRERSVNPRDWDSKLNFWKALINTWCVYNKICVFSETELKKCFIHNDRAPACLSIVLNEMYNNQELQTFEQFMEMPQKTWSGWALDVAIRKPFRWSFNKVKTTFSTSSKDAKYIHIPSIKILSENLFTAVPDKFRNRLLTIEELIEATNMKDIHVANIKLLLHYLLGQAKIDIYRNYSMENNEEHKVFLIKIGPINKKVVPVTEIDTGKYKLEQNEKYLIKLLEELENEKSEATKNAKLYLAKGMRQMAKNCLRKQHEIDKRIEKQITVLENVQTLLGRINTAESDSNVVESYRRGVAALKTVFKENGLSEDLVSDTMLEVGEVLDIHDDIQTTLAQSVTSTMDAELEEELAELLQDTTSNDIPPPPGGGTSDEDTSTDDLERRLKELKFPSVPTNVPTSPPIKSYIPSV